MMTGTRLDPPFGTRIDRARPIRFRFDGIEYSGFAGDTIASALLANGRFVLSRSFKYHRRRAPLSMAGLEANTLVQIGDEPNVPADLEPIVEGLVAEAQNVNGSLDHDRDAILDKLGRFLPVGFYYETFYKPRGAWRFWEPFIRRKAGLGRVNAGAHAHPYRDKQFLFCDVLVIGGGPAGLSAARQAAHSGMRVMIVESEPELGGALRYQRPDPGARESDAELGQLLPASEDAGIVALTGTTVTGAFADGWLSAIQGSRLLKIRAKQIVLATGGYEQIAVFRNNDLPGILMGTAVQRLIRLYGVRPGRRAVVATGTDEGYSVALDLLDAGVEVAELIEFRETARESLVSALVGRGVAIHARQGLVEAVRGADGHIGAVRFAERSDGSPNKESTRSVACDLLAISAGAMPAIHLAAQAGASIAYAGQASSFVAERVPAGWHIAGSSRGLRGHRAVIADGELAGWRAVKALGADAGAAPLPREDEVALPFDQPIFPHPKGRDFVDFDEDLQVKDLEETVARGYEDIQLLKRFSTLGMGPSQGRHSQLAGARVVASVTGREVGDVNITTARPPLVGEKLSLLGGRGFDPVRRTSIHNAHVVGGAQFTPAGLWLRPAYYGSRTERERSIANEVSAVRQGVGLIDVSTLGKLEVRGPDAGAFLERIYTGTFAQQPVGGVRYCVMTNEMGTVVDDGVAARLHPRHFYVTATTTGVDAVQRQMLWWNAQWRLDVDIANVTAGFAAVNLAGPRSRDVLSACVSDLDLSAEAFPYMTARIAHVASIPSRIMRVGFVGELGYEIHVPSGEGEALWESLLKAGERLGIRPFGLEAQRLLRLQKGHIIVGQDTDGLSHPDEVHCGWTVRMTKPFFVGKRSIEMLRRAPPSRRLVAFTLPSESPCPQEGNIVLKDAEFSGYVTSVGRLSTTGAVIGLAFADVSQSAAGADLPIKLTDGRILKATATTGPFYDPQSSRQKA